MPPDETARLPAAPRKSYSGVRTPAGSVVAVTTAQQGVPSSRLLSLRHDLCKHMADFDWGASGPGSAQLALAILADYLPDARRAVQLHHHFKQDVVTGFPYEAWTLSDEALDRWLLHLDN